jgi:hypothetical protein
LFNIKGPMGTCQGASPVRMGIIMLTELANPKLF